MHKIADIVHAKKGNKSLILGMDHNMDLLKSAYHHATSTFLDGLVNREIYPTITRPTCIAQTSATLIDNVFVSKDLHKCFDSGILLSDILDHLPSLVLLKQNKLTSKEPLEFLSRNQTEAKISCIKNELNKVDWNGVLNSDDVSRNCETFSNIIETTMDMVAPLQNYRISGKWRYIKPWMTKGIERSSRKKIQFYKKILKWGSSKNDVNIYKQYRNTFNQTKRAAMWLYYSKKAEAFKKNTKELWKLINLTISKQKNSGSIIPHITVQGLKITNGQEIANTFAKHYTKIGANLALLIKKRTKSITGYLNEIPRLLNIITLDVIACKEIEKEINRLPNKSSSGCDNVSNLLKSLKLVLLTTCKSYYLNHCRLEFSQKK